MKVFVDDFSVFGLFFDDWLINLSKVLKRCSKKNLTLNWEKCHFMVTHGIVLGHVIPHNGIKIDKAKTDLIVNLSKVFSWTCRFLPSVH